MHKLLPLLVLALATACSPKVRTELTENSPSASKSTITSVSIFDIDQAVPASAKKLGRVRVFDGGLTLKCDWKTVLGKAQIEAINSGGNLLKITKHTVPGIMSSCHQIDADIYFVNETAADNGLVDTKTEVDSLPSYSKETSKALVVIPFQRHRISFSGGLSYLIAKTSSEVPADFKQYVTELKSGSHFSIDGGYFWKENIGLGLKYSSFYSNNSINNITLTDMNGQTRYGRMADNINTQFVGAVLYNRGYSKTRNIVWMMNASLGYIAYKNKATLVDDFVITGSTLGGGLDLGADFKLSKTLYLGLGIGYTVGVLKQLKYDNGVSQQTRKLEKDSYESMNRLDLSAGLRWAW